MPIRGLRRLVLIGVRHAYLSVSSIGPHRPRTNRSGRAAPVPPGRLLETLHGLGAPVELGPGGRCPGLLGRRWRPCAARRRRARPCARRCSPPCQATTRCAVGLPSWSEPRCHAPCDGGGRGGATRWPLTCTASPTSNARPSRRATSVREASARARPIATPTPPRRCYVRGSTTSSP